MIEKFPRHFELFRQFRGERFHSESLGRVMPAEEKIDSQFFRRDRRPMRRFAGDVGVHPFARRLVNFAARAAGHETDALRLHRAGADAADRSA